MARSRMGGSKCSLCRAELVAPARGCLVPAVARGRAAPTSAAACILLAKRQQPRVSPRETRVSRLPREWRELVPRAPGVSCDIYVRSI